MKFKLKRLSLSRKHSLYGLIFVSPFILGFIFLFLSSIFFLIKLSFSSHDITIQGLQLDNVGFENYYRSLFIETGFIPKVFNSLKNMMITSPVILLYSFFIATVLNQKFKGRMLARVLFFLPVIITSGMAAYLQRYTIASSALSLLGGKTGSFTSVDFTSGVMNIFQSFLTENIMNYFNEITSKIYSTVSSSGVQIVIFLAGLQTISPSLYEASAIEGSSSWEDFWKITLPMISPLIIVNLVYTLIDSLTGTSNDVIVSIFKSGQSQFCYASAQSIIYFIIVFTILGLTISVINRFVFYDN